MLAEAGAKLAHAPVVCTDIVSAVTDVVGMRAAGVTVGLGCDTVINDILAVARIAYLMHGQAAGIPLYDPVGFTTEDAFDMATIDGARALLWEHEIAADDPDDGEPVSLDQWIERDGVYCLKIKLLGNDMEWDVQRTLDVYAVGREALAKQGREEIYLTADTNEICETPDYMVEYLERVREQSPAAYEALLYVEQPTHRDLDRAPFRMDGIDKLKPVIMDESLYNHRQYERAKELGWSGIALKVCKGHSHSLLFTALATHDGLPYTVQDLTNPDLSLIHSVSFAARINPMMGVECNSRQFCPASNGAVAAVHPQIANVRNGVAHTGTLTGTGLGYQVERILAFAP